MYPGEDEHSWANALCTHVFNIYLVSTCCVQRTMEIKSESYSAFLALRKSSQVFMLMQVIINVNVTAAKDRDVQRAVLK